METALIIIFMIAMTAAFMFVMYRTNQNSIQKLLRGERTLDDREVFMRNAPILTARVIQMVQQINPQAKGIAKVNLDLEIIQPGSAPVVTKTTWLVEIPSLRELDPGKEVQVKFDPKRPERVFPAVPWARLWVFG